MFTMYAEDRLSQDSLTHPQCMKCMNRRQRYGTLSCARQPHDYDTQERRDIVAWLMNGHYKCPSFIQVPT